MNKLEQARQEINEIDREMARLFEKRMQCSAVVADYKRQNGLSIRDKAREEELIARNLQGLQEPALGQFYVPFLQKTIDLSCRYQEKLLSGMQVAYCGVEGAFAYLAAKKMFPEAELVGFQTFSAAYQAVEKGELDSAVLPLENSYAGEVGNVMDLLFSGKLYINQVTDVEIDHCLLAKKGTRMEDIRTVISHPQALQQCDDYLAAHGLQSEEYSNTAAAAKYVRDCGDRTVAAIASSETAALFGLEILEKHINMVRTNTTRFAALSLSQNQPSYTGKREDENFILLFTVQNEAGALAQTLNIIGAHGYNMRSLRSRPMKGLLWNYYFYIEAEGCINTQNGKELLQELTATCAKLKLAGSYTSHQVG